MDFGHRPWILPPPGDLTLESFLVRRGMTRADLSPEPDDPRLIHQMVEGVAEIRWAIETGRRVGVYGDYDADGLCATALLTRALRQAGADVVPFIPNREDGFGLSPAAVGRMRGQGVQLGITVDNGSDRRAVIQSARRAGLHMIVTDHHPIRIEEAARPEALINPQHPNSLYHFRDLCGAGVALAVVLALAYPADGGRPLLAAADAWALAPYAAVATIADVVPLRGANRLIVRYGLEHFRDWPGLRALADVSGVRWPLARDIAFKLAPRLNAAGRMAETRTALELLLADGDLEADVLASELDALNLRRRGLTADITEQAMRRVAGPGGLPDADRSIVVWDRGWPQGVVGLVAADLAEAFCRPVFVGGGSGVDDLIHGSARTGAFMPSGELVSCAAILREARAICESSGGHSAAAGFTVQEGRMDAFVAAIEGAARVRMGGHEPIRPVIADAVCDLPEGPEMSWLEMLEPSGAGLAAPLLVTREVEVVGRRRLGSGGVSLRLRQGERDARGLYFGAEPPIRGALIDVAYTPEIGQGGIVLMVEAVRRAGSGEPRWWPTRAADVAPLGAAGPV